MHSVLEYIFVLFTILNYISVYYLKFSGIINLLWQIIAFILCVTALSRISVNNLHKLFIFVFTYSSFVIIFLIIYYIKFPFNFVQHLFIDIIDPILLVICFMGTNKNNVLNNSLLYKFERCMIIIAYVSLVFWILFSLNLIKPNMTFTGGLIPAPGFSYIYFISQGKINFLGISNIIRNTSIFSEANGFAYLLCIALIIELFIKHHKTIINSNIIILLLTIFTTTSTNGILISVPALLYYLIVVINNRYMRILFLLLIPLSIMFIEFTMNNKVGNVNDITSSYSIRMNDVYASIQAWKMHPFFGNGIDNIPSISQFMYTFRMFMGSTGSSSGFLSALAYGGIIYGLYYILPMLLSIKCSSRIFGFAVISFTLDIFTSEFYAFSYVMLIAYIWACIIQYNNIGKRSYNKEV